MGKISKGLALAPILTIAISCLTLTIVKPANAQLITQGSPTSNETSPFVDFNVNSNFSQQANQPLILNLTAVAADSPEGRLYGVLNLSYVASWLNTPVVLYSWNGNPANLNDWFANNSNINPNPNTHLSWAYHSQTTNGVEIYSTEGPPNWVYYNLVLTDIPLSQQQINFTVVKAALYGINPLVYAEIASNSTIDFTVTNKPLLSPSVPELSLLAILPPLLFVFSIAVALRHQKTTNLKQ